MSYLLDTNAAVALLNDEPRAVRGRFRQAAASGASLAVSSIVLFELWHGVAKSSRPKENGERVRVFLSGRVDVLAFEEEDAVSAGALRAELSAAGTPIGPYDVLIAGQALRHGATLVTANVAEFSCVRNLSWQDWTQ